MHIHKHLVTKHMVSNRQASPTLLGTSHACAMHVVYFKIIVCSEDWNVCTSLPAAPVLSMDFSKKDEEDVYLFLVEQGVKESAAQVIQGTLATY